MSDDDDKDPRPPMHWGDMGALVLAGGFSLFGLYLIVNMVIGGHPLAVLFRKAPQEAPHPLTQAEWNEKKFSTSPGEIVLSTSAARPAGSAFPPVKDWTSLHIRLDRTGCFGTCPSYSVDIAGDGTVVYQGRACVAEKGERRATIPAADVRDLVAKFQDVDYFTLHDTYRAGITDNPTFTTSIAFDGRKKSVIDYVGASAGMPHKVTALEDAIDKAAGTKRWIGEEKRPCSPPVRLEVPASSAYIPAIPDNRTYCCVAVARPPRGKSFSMAKLYPAIHDEGIR